MAANSFQKRLRDVIHALDIEHQDFARAGDVSKATLSGYIQSDRQPKADTLGRWVEKYAINANWLLTGKGSMFQGQEHEEPPSKQPQTETGKELEEIRTTLQAVGASEDEIKQALIDYVSGGRIARDRSTGTDDGSI